MIGKRIDTAKFVIEWVSTLEKQIQEILDASLPDKQQNKAASSISYDKFRVAQKALQTKLSDWTLEEECSPST